MLSRLKQRNFPYSQIMLVTKFFLKQNAVIFVDGRQLVLGTDFCERVVLHRLNNNKFDVDSRREDTPRQRIKCLLFFVFDFCRRNVPNIIADCQECVVAGRRKKNRHRVELHFPCFRVWATQLHEQYSNLAAMVSTFFRICKEKVFESKCKCIHRCLLQLDVSLILKLLFFLFVTRM